MNKNSKRNSILKSAEKIMSVKGLNSSTISEIAKDAGVTDSVIYQFFKGKEDLLFSVAGERMTDVIAHLNEHLEGIRDPESRLRKMIWFHLHYNDTFRDYACLLLLECRSNRNFYMHDAYQLIRKYAGIMLHILEDGIKNQVFRSDVNMRLVRDMIFGLLDMENLGCLAAHETEQTASDLDDIMSLIIPMITVRPLTTEIDKRNKILWSAEQVFAQKGYNQATVADIARLANVAEGTVYEYFRNKEDLLFSIPEQRFKDYLERLEELFEIKTPLRKLRRLIRYHFMLYMTHQNYTKVFLLNIQLNKEFYDLDVYKKFRQYTDFIESVLDEGKKDGTIRPEINNRIFRNLFIGAFSHMALRWLILEQEGKTDKMKEIDDVVSLLTRAVAIHR
ncbi:MAG: TetR/AcrR family transcriptional regulator [Thermodesulfobacteriota bacterium]